MIFIHLSILVVHLPFFFFFLIIFFLIIFFYFRFFFFFAILRLVNVTPLSSDDFLLFDVISVGIVVVENSGLPFVC